MTASRILTGIPALDSALSGGISTGSAVLLLTESSIDAARLMQTVLLNLWREDKDALYITTKKSVESLCFELDERFNVNSCIFDAGIPDEDTLVHVLEKIADLPAKSCVFLDSLTSLVPFAEQNFPLFYQRLNKSLRDFAEKKISCIFLLSASAFAKEHEVCFTDLFSHVWRLKQDSAELKSKRILSIESITQDASLSPRDELQLSAALSSDGTIVLSHLRRIR